jgi:ABC-type lipoprotein export system ATPase subunit
VTLARLPHAFLVTHEADIAAHARRVVTLRDGLIERDERTDGTR